MRLHSLCLYTSWSRFQVLGKTVCVSAKLRVQESEHTVTSQKWAHLWSAQNLFADFAKCNKKRRPSGLRHSHVRLVGRYALRQAWDACAVHLLFLVMVQ